MKKKFSTAWKSSSQTRKQRKYMANAPLHIKQKFVAAHLSKELKKRYKKRSLKLREGDIVLIMRGQFKKKSGKIIEVDLKRTKVYVEGIDMTKKNGSKVRYPLHPSNLLITELKLDDKMRQKILTRGKYGAEPSVKTSSS
ncbi:MAG: 50S ribosomal protein L24 [Candidatus Woesearchaeota archaeon]|nr:MAG: 50S ribosomal protein L24 [Candidatus Woesearchaeota archaeon]